MTRLIKIGNSQGVRIPKTYIKESGLQDRELQLTITQEGLLISPKEGLPREGWRKNIEQTLQKSSGSDEAREQAFLDDSDLEPFQW